MDRGSDFGRLPQLSPIRPLYLQKESSPVHTTHSQARLNNKKLQLQDKRAAPPTFSIFPPRTSSIPKCDASGKSRETSEAFPFPENAAPSTLSKQTEKHQSATSSNGDSSIASARSNVSSVKAYYLSDTSSAMMGDFIPISSADLKSAQPPKKAFVVTDSMVPDAQSVVMSGIATSDAKFENVTRPVNPYEFEPDTLYINSSHQNETSDFVRKHGSSPAVLPSHQFGHVKNRYSDGNVSPLASKHTVPITPSEKPSRQGLQRYRSESSPSMPPLRFAERQDPRSSPTYRSHRGMNDSHASPNGLIRSQPSRRFNQDARLDPYQSPEDHIMERRSRSPSRSRAPVSVQSNGDNVSTHMASKYRSVSPTKALDDVFERDEAAYQYPKTPSSRPKKRSRSPMKKMFGEHGWLGRTPDELEDVKHRVKAPSRKDEPSGSPQKKSSMMGKLKSKFEEFAEKADLAPKVPRSGHPKLSILARSLSPPVQAKIDMELELSLVHTANSFLMNQFRQGRMALESIKKVSDSWRGRGRPGVIEFMYDQATQRELVVANQHNFRFHGERAADDIRINSMLYNWKQVSNLMAIRTFCDADTVILKLIFDIEQILELLGATEPIMLRLQHIRAQANESMRIARRDEKPASQKHGREQEQAWDDRLSTAARSSTKSASQKHRGNQGHSRGNQSSSTTGSIATDKSFDDPYGGMKLVPDHYVESS